MSRILATGAEGFVGRHLLSELGDEGVPTSADVMDAEALSVAVRAAEPTAVVHLAALSSVAESWRDAGEVWRVNVLGTVNLLGVVRTEQPGARVLVVSSGEVYGRAETIPTPEPAPAAPLSPYAASKAAAELACAQMRRSSGLHVVVARAFTHVGPGQDERFAVSSWAKQIARLEAEGGGTLRVGDLTVRRDLTDVRDVCRAYRLLLDPSVPAGTYNVCSGAAVAMGDVLEMLVGMAEAAIEVKQDPALLRPVEVPVLCGDPSRLRAATGWAPAVPLETTLADTLEAARTVVKVGGNRGPS